MNDRLINPHQAASLLGTYRQILYQALRKDDAPLPDKEGLYDIEELRNWWSER